MAKLKVKFKKLIDNAVVPRLANDGDVGFDLFAPVSNDLSSNELILQPGVTKIKTGIAFADAFETLKSVSGIFYAKIEGRSGLASKGIIPVGGVIDPGYRGDITVALANITGQSYLLDLDKAIAQFVIYNVETDIILEEVDDIEESKRGISGFGSTDK